ncbi:MAG: carboxypeptidase regulatory-like domain-containing protein [Roseiflexaceae bacterium]
MRIKLSSSRRMPHVLLALVLWLSLLLPHANTPAPAYAADPLSTSGQWGSVIDWQIFGKHMAVLPNGNVLAWPTGQDAFVWNPTSQVKTAVPATFGDLHCAAQTILADGRVMVAGGTDVQIHNGTTVTALFDPATNVWTQGTPMHYPRWYPTTTTLPDGRVLVSSGDMPGGGRANTPEIYDPATNTWTELPAATKDIGLYPQMYVLPNGKVFKAGTTTGTYLLDTTTGTWTNGPTNAFGSSGYAESSAMYEPGKIIRSGGGDPSFANTAIVDMNVAGAQWKQTSPMNFPRRRHNMVILADGEVLAVGGTRSADDLGNGTTTGAVYEAEIWNPATELWTVVPRMAKDRMYHSAALLLPDGRVLTAGGENLGRMNAQIYSPPYLFKGARPAITSQPGVAAYGTNLSVTVSTDGSAISSVALIRPAAVTHAFDHDQRYVPLTFTQSGDMITANAPLNGNYAPPGYYMLVVTDSKGVPSVASWVRVDSTANLIPGTLSGNVTDRASNSPNAGVTVAYSGGTTTTDVNGDYALADVLPGEQLVTFSLVGYATIRRTQSVVGGEAATLNVVLDPPGTINGKATDSDSHAAIAGATILYDGGSTTTNGSGNYTIAGIPAGSQSLIASADGYESSDAQNATVPANSSVTANIALTAKPSFIAGEVHDSLTGELVAGATITTDSESATTDSLARYQIFVPPGTYNLTVSKSGYISAVHTGVIVTFGTYTAADLALTPLNPAVTFAPVADAYVDEALPATNNGATSTIRVLKGTGTSQAGYLRFNVAGLNRAVQSAKLRLYVTNPSPMGGSIYSVSNNYKASTSPWLENGVNWNNAPAIGGTPLSTLGAVVASTTTPVEFDVTAAFDGNGTYNFGLLSASANDVRYTSREGTANNRPQLVIQQSDDPLPSITGFSPASGLPGTEVTLNGTGFVGITSVRFNGIAAASYTVDSDTKIRAIVPVGAASGKLKLTIAGGSSNSEDTFSMLTPPSPPALDAFSPASGPAGTEVTIKGAGLGGATAVTFNGAPASSFTIDSDAQIRAIVPAGATSGKLIITTSAGSTTSVASFAVTDAGPGPTAPPTYSVYVALINGGSAAAKHMYAVQTTEWSDSTNKRGYICELEGR